MELVKDLPESVQLRILSLLSTHAQPHSPETTHKSTRCPEDSALMGIWGPRGEPCPPCPYTDTLRVEAYVRQLHQKSYVILDGLLGSDIIHPSPAASLVPSNLQGDTSSRHPADTTERAGSSSSLDPHVQVQRAREEAANYPSLRKGIMGGGVDKWTNQIFRGDHISFLLPENERSRGHVGLATVLQTLESLRPILTAQGFQVDGRVTFQLACYPGNGESYVRHRDWSPSCPKRRVTATYYLNPTWHTQTAGGQLRLYLSGCASSAEQAPCTKDPVPLCEEYGRDEPAQRTGGKDVVDGTEVTHTSGCHVTTSPNAPGGESGKRTCATDTDQENHVDVDPIGDRLVLFQSATWHEVLPSFHPRFAITAWFSASESKPEAVPPVPPPTASHPAPPNPRSPQPRTASPTLPRPSLPPTPLIFVSVACYRDSECRWTVRDLFAKAAFPSHVRVGIVWQVDREEDGGMMDIWGGGEGGGGYEGNVRQMVLDWREATGPCKARHLAQTMWQGEEYFLQIDAHMRFAPGWDTRLLRMLRAAEKFSPKPVLSTYPPSYTGLGQDAKFCAEPQPVLLCASRFGQDKMLRIQGRRLGTEPQEPIRSRFWAAGYSFSSARLIEEVPYDPNLPSLFFGEESSMAVRMFTAGWDFFAPTETVVFHLWTKIHRPMEGKKRESEQARGVKEVSEAWVRSLLCWRGASEGGMCDKCGEGGAGAGAGGGRNGVCVGNGGKGMGEGEGEGEVGNVGGDGMGGCERVREGECIGGGRVGNGVARSVKEFVDFCGVDFCEQRIYEEARRGGVDREALLDSVFDEPLSESGDK